MLDLLPSDIKRELRTAHFAKRIYYLPEVTSTNDIAIELAKEGEENGTLVVTDYQTRGKGRSARTWESPRGRDLLFSLILRPGKQVTSVLSLTLVFSCTIAEVLDSYLPSSVAVKWPNDVHADRKKICGILAEGSSCGRITEFLVVGVGINVNSRESEIDPSLRKKAVSCSMITGKDLPRAGLLGDLLLSLEEAYSRFLSEGFGVFVDQYNSMLLMKGETITFKEKGEVKSGRVEGVNHDGGLIVSIPDGKRIVLYECEIF